MEQNLRRSVPQCHHLIQKWRRKRKSGEEASFFSFKKKKTATLWQNAWLDVWFDCLIYFCVKLIGKHCTVKTWKLKGSGEICSSDTDWNGEDARVDTHRAEDQLPSEWAPCWKIWHISPLTTGAPGADLIRQPAAFLKWLYPCHTTANGGRTQCSYLQFVSQLSFTGRIRVQFNWSLGVIRKDDSRKEDGTGMLDLPAWAFWKYIRYFNLNANTS